MVKIKLHKKKTFIIFNYNINRHILTCFKHADGPRDFAGLFRYRGGGLDYP